MLAGELRKAKLYPIETPNNSPAINHGKRFVIVSSALSRLLLWLPSTRAAWLQVQGIGSVAGQPIDREGDGV